MKLREIAFLGDSFTWGEGLELYLDTPFWVKQRNKQSSWQELKHIQTQESINFREKNRFANIVSEYFGANLIIDDSNGGYIGNLTDYCIKIINSKIPPEFLIIQFSSFIRNPIHYHLGSYKNECKCQKCMSYNPGGTIHGFFHLTNTINKKYNQENLNKEDEFYLSWLNDEFGFENLYLDDSGDSHLFALNYLNSIIDTYSYFHISYLLKKYIKPIEDRGTSIIYIDSWDVDSSKILHNIPVIKDKILFLKKYNKEGIEDFTQYYNEFEKSFSHTRIGNEFPSTGNGHPTLKQHKHISESVIRVIEKSNKKSFFKLF